MTTSAITVTDDTWVQLLNGSGIVEVSELGVLCLHIGTVEPAADTIAFHSFRDIHHAFDYAGTEKVYGKNGSPGSLSVIVTPLI